LHIMHESKFRGTDPSGMSIEEPHREKRRGISHLKEGVKSIIAAVADRGKDYGAWETVSLDSDLLRGNIMNVDYYEDPIRQSVKGFKNGGDDSYVISPIDSSNKRSNQFYNCTGVVATGQDKITGEDVSFISHQDPVYLFRRNGRDTFVKDLEERLDDLRQRCVEGTVDAVILGGNNFRVKEYNASIELLDGVIEKTLGFKSDVVTGPKVERGPDNILYDNKNRRLYIIRPEVGDNTTKSYSPDQLNERQADWHKWHDTEGQWW
jgi:hypothetical protein